MSESIYLLYLRKSRADNPEESIEEVLSKHETMLQEYMKREYGFTIPEEDIYREVCSGESIQDRTEIKKVLGRIEDPEVKGVVVIEPQRLSRGDLIDCGKLINDFRYTKTLVITPMMTYDLENKMERKFFQDELLRGKDYLDYTKEILLRGRIASVKRGCYIARVAPYGYDKVKIGKDHTLEPNAQAEYVKLIFDWYVNDGLTYYQIACKLNDMGVKPLLKEKWCKSSITYILKNRHYIGKVFFNKVKETILIENGQRITKRLNQPEEEIIIADGKHPAIIDNETFEKAQERMTQNVNPKLKADYELTNPLASILCCKKCGRNMVLHPYAHAENRFNCPERPICYKSVRYSELMNAVITALETVELPKLEAKLQNNDGNSANIKRNLIANLEKEMIELKAQEEKQYDLLEKGIYSEELFEKRNNALRDKMEALKKQIRETKESIPKEVDYAEKIISLKKAIESLKDDSITPAAKNKFVKAIVKKIDFSTPIPQDRKRNSPFFLDIYLLL